MKINLTDVPEQQFPTRLGPGLHDVEITGLVESDLGEEKEYLQFSVVNPQGEYGERFYLNDKAYKWSMGKLRELALSCGASEDEVDKFVTVDALGKFITGKKIRIKLKGEEYVGQDGQIRVGSKLPLMKFSEPLTSNGLSFNAERDIVRLPKEQIPSEVPASTSKDDEDMPPF